MEGRQRIQKADRGRRKLEQTQKADQVARLDPLFRYRKRAGRWYNLEEENVLLGGNGMGESKEDKRMMAKW
ncbi:hypothetical protein ACXO22_03460, partial [Lactobacillus delbrueckii subsp. bulgaricus]